jgi:8-oxo-dGTP pyrophosphatase MutT (NUDIX family)
MTTTLNRAAATRQVFFHDDSAPTATVVTPSAFVVARSRGGRLLLVRRCDAGLWELPGGRVDVGESAEDAAVRETYEEAGVHVVITGLIGLFTDPRHVIRAPGGDVRQQFAVVFRARALDEAPHRDMHETSDAAWVRPSDVAHVPIDRPIRGWIDRATANDSRPHLG